MGSCWTSWPPCALAAGPPPQNKSPSPGPPTRQPADRRRLRPDGSSINHSIKAVLAVIKQSVYRVCLSASLLGATATATASLHPLLTLLDGPPTRISPPSPSHRRCACSCICTLTLALALAPAPPIFPFPAFPRSLISLSSLLHAPFSHRLAHTLSLPHPKLSVTQRSRSEAFVSARSPPFLFSPGSCLPSPCRCRRWPPQNPPFLACLRGPHHHPFACLLHPTPIVRPASEPGYVSLASTNQHCTAHCVRAPGHSVAFAHLRASHRRLAPLRLTFLVALPSQHAS